MAKKEEKIKEVPGLKQTVGKEIVGNAIIMTIIVMASWGMTFHASWGPARGLSTYLGFIACMIPFFTVIQAYVPFINKRAELGHGKWELKEDEVGLPARTPDQYMDTHTSPRLGLWFWYNLYHSGLNTIKSLGTTGNSGHYHCTCF